MRQTQNHPARGWLGTCFCAGKMVHTFTVGDILGEVRAAVVVLVPPAPGGSMAGCRETRLRGASGNSRVLRRDDFFAFGDVAHPCCHTSRKENSAALASSHLQSRQCLSQGRTAVSVLRKSVFSQRFDARPCRPAFPRGAAHLGQHRDRVPTL